MHLTSLSYSEFGGQQNEWILEKASLDEITLIVGANSAGKSRVLAVINSLARLLSGEHKKLYSSGTYNVCLADGPRVLEYEFEIADGKITRERLTQDKQTLLDRGLDGSGTIWASELDKAIRFEAPQSVIAANVRRDAIQHPFLQQLYDWAKHVRHYQFGTSLGRDRLYGVTEIESPGSGQNESFDADAVATLYVRSWRDFGDSFDTAVLKDLKDLGYDCTDVGVERVDPALISIKGPPVFTLFVKESSLPCKTLQLNMSAGMFRALALVIHLNDCIFRKIPGTLLIDDIGEGLDFSRAQACIGLLIDRAKNHRFQLIMTTNDRFVMNGVQLEYWSVIKRVAGKVRLINKRNSPTLFEDFQDLGLNNFDFFSTNFFEQGLK